MISLSSTIAKNFSPELLKQIGDRMKAEPGDLLLFVADQWKATCKALHALRTKLGAEMKLYDPRAMHFSWVVEFPMFDYDDEARRWVAMHHPFTSPRDQDFGLLETDQAMPMAMVGFADWWIFGAVLTPLLVLALSAGFAAIASLTRHLAARVAALATAVTLAWNAELDFASAFVALRFALIAALWFAVMDFPELGRRRSKPPVRPPR